MNNDRLNALYFLGGIAIGGAATYFLTSEEGKRMSKNIMDSIKTNSNEVKESMDDTKRQMEQTIDMGLEQIEQTKDSLMKLKDNIVVSAKETMRDSISEFKQGIHNGRKKLENV